MKTFTEKQAEYIASKRKLLEKKMIDICTIGVQNTMNHSQEPMKYCIEISMGNSMAGIGINVYDKDKNIESADCYGVFWPFIIIAFFNKERFDNDVNEKLNELETIRKIAKKYYDLNKK